MASCYMFTFFIFCVSSYALIKVPSLSHRARHVYTLWQNEKNISHKLDTL